MKGVLLVVEPMSMPVETLAIEAPGIKVQTVEALPTIGKVRVKRDSVKERALRRGAN